MSGVGESEAGHRAVERGGVGADRADLARSSAARGLPGRRAPRRRAGPGGRADVDPIERAIIKAALDQLVADGIKPAAIIAVAEDLARPRVVEGTREQYERIAELIDQLVGCWSTDGVMQFLKFHQNQGIPVAISIEILGRVAKVRPDKPWALINTIMHKDYPHWCGRGK